MVICLERGADLHMAQLMPLPLTVSCFSKIQIGFTFLVLAHPGSPGKRAVKRVCVCMCHLQADCQEPGSAPEPYTRQSSMGYVYLFNVVIAIALCLSLSVCLSQAGVLSDEWTNPAMFGMEASFDQSYTGNSDIFKNKDTFLWNLVLNSATVNN